MEGALVSFIHFSVSREQVTAQHKSKIKLLKATELHVKNLDKGNAANLLRVNFSWCLSCSWYWIVGQ